MAALRRWVGVVALFLAGVTLALLLGNPLLSGIVSILTCAGCAVMAAGVLRRRGDPYDLRRLHDTIPLPEDGREGPEDQTGYCPVCGHFVESPFQPCPKCGSAV